jgi:hypothetical protein
MEVSIPVCLWCSASFAGVRSNAESIRWTKITQSCENYCKIGDVLQLPFDPNDWISKATAVVVGATLMSVGEALYPQIQRCNPKAARRGLVLGLLGASGLLVLLKLTCSATGLCNTSVS